MLELDHVFCMVSDPVMAARRLEQGGWSLDAGQAHPGQGTRNRRLVWRRQYFELLWVTDRSEARSNPLRLDRRADWTSTGASPVGLAFRGPALDGGDFWLYDALGPRIWIHRDSERAPERPLVFVLEIGAEGMARRGRRSRPRDHPQPGELSEVRVHGPAAPSLPAFAGPPVVYADGAHLLELVVRDQGAPRTIADGLVIRA